MDTSNFRAIVARIGTSPAAHRLAERCEVASFENDRLTLALPAADEALRTPAAQSALWAALSVCYGRPIRLEIRVGRETTQ